MIFSLQKFKTIIAQIMVTLYLFLLKTYVNLKWTVDIFKNATTPTNNSTKLFNNLKQGRIYFSEAYEIN